MLLHFSMQFPPQMHVPLFGTHWWNPLASPAHCCRLPATSPDCQALPCSVKSMATFSCSCLCQNGQPLGSIQPAASACHCSFMSSTGRLCVQCSSADALRCLSAVPCSPSPGELQAQKSPKASTGQKAASCSSALVPERAEHHSLRARHQWDAAAAGVTVSFQPEQKAFGAGICSAKQQVAITTSQRTSCTVSSIRSSMAALPHGATVLRHNYHVLTSKHATQAD